MNETSTQLFDHLIDPKDAENNSITEGTNTEIEDGGSKVDRLKQELIKSDGLLRVQE